MLKRSLGKDKTVVIAIDKMLDQFALDPTMTAPSRDAYIVTNEDISAKRLKDKFEQALLSKHPATKVIFINKSSKPLYPNGLQGLDAILQKPKPNDITQTISAVIAAGQVSNVIDNSMNTSVEIPDYNPDAPQAYIPDTTPEEEPEIYEEPAELNIPAPAPIPEPEPEPVERKSTLIERIEHAGSVGDVNVLMREITATNLIKDLYETNSTYAGIEEKLKSLNDIIFNIMSETNTSLNEKMSKIHAMLHDKAFFRAKGDTLIEQRLEEVVDCLCTHTSSLLESRLSEIDSAIRKAITDKDMENSSARLGGLNEERANLIIELHTLEQEIADIYKGTDRLIISSATAIAQEASDATGNDVINQHLKARGDSILSEETIYAIKAAEEMSADKVPTAFKEMKLKTVNTLTLLRKLFDVDAEVIAAQQQIINFLRSNNVENTVVAESLIKQSLRVYVGEESTGRTIIPYLISRYKSRQNANVLLLDLTGTVKYTQYGIKYTNLDSYLTELQEKEFMLAAGTIDNSVSAAQRVVNTLLKAADYYRVINVVLTPEQNELFQTIAQDVLSINFIVDANPTHIDSMKKVIEQCNVPNVAKRVIINRCDIPIRTIITRLGLDDEIDYQVCTIPTVNVLTDASLNGYNPYGISSVDLVMEEVLKHA
jgi:hypothetical protein